MTAAVSLADYRARKARRAMWHKPVDVMEAWQSPEWAAMTLAQLFPLHTTVYSPWPGASVLPPCDMEDL